MNLDKILEELGKQYTAIDSDHFSQRVDLTESQRRWKHETEQAKAQLIQYIATELQQFADSVKELDTSGVHDPEAVQDYIDKCLASQRERLDSV